MVKYLIAFLAKSDGLLSRLNKVKFKFRSGKFKFWNENS